MPGRATGPRVGRQAAAGERGTELVQGLDDHDVFVDAADGQPLVRLRM
jgi:hypothetical protein